MRSLLFALFCACITSAAAQQPGTQLGAAIVMGYGEIIAGQPAVDGTAAALRVFQQSETGWHLAATHVMPDIVQSDAFGFVMDLDGDLLAVSAFLQSEGHGTVYLFKRDESSGEWSQVRSINGNRTDARLGTSLDVQGGMLLAGAPGINSVLIAHRAGTHEQSTEWLSPENLAPGDRFGEAVAFDGERIYVGAPGRDSLAGAVYVFRSTDSGYEEETVLSATSHRGFGKALTVIESGNILVQAPGISYAEYRELGLERPQGDAGRRENRSLLELTRESSGMWIQSTVMDSLPDAALMRHYAFPLAANSEHFAIASPNDEKAIQVHTRDSAAKTWSHAADVGISTSEQALGQYVAMDGNNMAAVAPGAVFEQGAIVVFSINGGDIERTGRITLVEEVALEPSGRVDCEDGAALSFTCSNVDLLAFLPIDAIGGAPTTEMSDIWGWTDPVTGAEYALAGRTDGTSFVDISNPSAPIFVGDLPLTPGARPTYWRDIKVYKDHAFIVADATDDHGMQVFDLTRLRDVSEPPVVFEPLMTYDVVDNAHNIIINEETGYAFLVGAGGGGRSCGGALHMVNIQDPANPVFEGCTSREVAGGRGTHDAQCVTYRGPDADHFGREICFNSNGTVLNIADVTDKENPVTIFNASYPNVRYAHQGWLTDDHSFFYLNDETDELGGAVTNTRTLIWDVTDLDDPQLAREFLSDNTASDHNLYVRGNLMYQSNYGSGLRIFDISDYLNPVEVGFFDTVTAVPDAPGFIGSWSNYPYFESGAIVVTSINEGLFVLKKREVDT